MEKEGLVRSITALEEAGVKIGNIVTDRHPQIQKFLREEKPTIQHFFDVWHVAKGMFFFILSMLLKLILRQDNITNEMHIEVLTST